MRLARRALLLLAFYLLTSAATASAECAWVLWIRDPLGWSLISAVSTKEECNKAMERKSAQVRAGREALRLPSTPLPDYYCLPDTVDPRGPKGK